MIKMIKLLINYFKWMWWRWWVVMKILFLYDVYRTITWKYIKWGQQSTLWCIHFLRSNLLHVEEIYTVDGLDTWKTKNIFWKCTIEHLLSILVNTILSDHDMENWFDVEWAYVNQNSINCEWDNKESFYSLFLLCISVPPMIYHIKLIENQASYNCCKHKYAQFYVLVVQDNIIGKKIILKFTLNWL
jgi:hypothetical protein